MSQVVLKAADNFFDPFGQGFENARRAKSLEPSFGKIILDSWCDQEEPAERVIIGAQKVAIATRDYGY